ncbi:MAG: hypothetical protein Q9221_005869 [Calogaya cf. arnoldii]
MATPPPGAPAQDAPPPADPSAEPTNDQPTPAEPITEPTNPPPSNEPTAPPPRSNAPSPDETKPPPRRSKRGRHESPEFKHGVEGVESASKRQKRSKTAPAEPSADPTDTQSTPADPTQPPSKKPTSKKNDTLQSLERLSPPLLSPTPIPSPWSLVLLANEVRRAGLVPRDFTWTYQTEPLYKMPVIKDSFSICLAGGMPLEHLFDAGAAFVTCVRSPGDRIAGGGMGKWLPNGGNPDGAAAGGGKGGAKKAGWNCVRPVVSDVWVAQRAQINWDDAVSALGASTVRGKLNPLKPRRAAEFFRIGEDYFFWWQHSRAVRVNGRWVIQPHTPGEEEGGPDVAVGPLPDFCAIQVEDAVLFFWRNGEVRRFLPGSVEGDRVRLGEEGERVREEGERKREREVKEKEAKEKEAKDKDEAGRKRDEEQQRKSREAEETLRKERKAKEREKKVREEAARKRKEKSDGLLRQMKEKWQAEEAEETVRVEREAEEREKKEREMKEREKEEREEAERNEVLRQITQKFAAAKQVAAAQQVDPTHHPQLPYAELEDRRYRWKLIWNRGLQRHTQQRNQTDDRTCHKIRHWWNLSSDDVSLGIATLWNAIVLQDRGPKFAFNYFDQAYVRGMFVVEGEKRAKVMAAVYGPNDYLIPITWGAYQSPPNSAGWPPGQDPNANKPPPTNPGKDDHEDIDAAVGHTLFAVAQRIKKDPKGGDQIRAIVMDSAPHGGPGHRKRIEDDIGKTVRRTGWLGMDMNGQQLENRDAPPNISFQDLRVPLQVSVNSCGVHAILHAWGWMMGLPALDSIIRPPCRKIETEKQKAEEETEFIDNALLMINLALAGHMDLRTIQAFFNYYGFCRLQDPENPEEAKPEAVVATRMNQEILEDRLDGLRALERVGAGQPTVNEFPEEDIRDVRWVIASGKHSEAVEWLRMANGDVLLAIDLATKES